jgi:tripartite-type tricarboxylate transporter receptor subunit TctC
MTRPQAALRRAAHRSSALLALVTAMALALNSCGWGSQSSDESSGENPLEGESITVVVGFDPGGGFDTYARTFAPYLGEALGANVTVENVPGAGGLLALKQVLAAEPDGTTLYLMDGNGISGSVLAGAEEVDFSLDDIGYIGRVADYTEVVGAGTDSGYESFEEALNNSSDFRWGADGPGGSMYLGPNVLMGMFDKRPNIITGYDGSSAVQAAVVAGEADASFVAEEQQEPFVESGDIDPLLIMGEKPSEKFPDTPTVLDMDLNEEQEAIAQAYFSMVELGRVLVTSPDVPDNVMNELRDAVAEMLENPDLVAEFEKKALPINYLDAEGLEETVNEIQNSPDSYVELVKRGY